MFGQQLAAQAGVPQGQAPQAPQGPQAPASPIDEINAKLDQILMLLAKDLQGDKAEAQAGPAPVSQPPIG